MCVSSCTHTQQANREDDPLAGHRVHCWVAILPGKRDVKTGVLLGVFACVFLPACACTSTHAQRTQPHEYTHAAHRHTYASSRIIAHYRARHRARLTPSQIRLVDESQSSLIRHILVWNSKYAYSTHSQTSTRPRSHTHTPSTRMDLGKHTVRRAAHSHTHPPPPLTFPAYLFSRTHAARTHERTHAHTHTHTHAHSLHACTGLRTYTYSTSSQVSNRCGITATIGSTCNQNCLLQR